MCLSLSVVVEGSTGTVDCCLEHAYQILTFPALPVVSVQFAFSDRGLGMDVVHQRCAGLDIAKRSVTVCVRVAGAGSRATSQKVTTWGSMTNQILALREHLLAEQVSCVVMEATGDYWKPFYYLLEDAGFELMLVNARHVKNMPGRKTDVSDAAWLAQLAAHGLVRACLVPPAPVRELRDLTRTRTVLTRDRSREILRLEKVLEDAGIKLSSVVSELNGVSSRAMLRALAAGERDPATLADLAQRRLRPKIGQLTEALTGRFSDHHAFLTTMHLDVIDHLTAKIDELDQRIEVVMEPFRAFQDLICTIPSVSQTTAQILIAETGGDNPVPDRKPPHLLGRGMPRQPRIRWPGEINQDPPRQCLPERCPRHCPSPSPAATTPTSPPSTDVSPADAGPAEPSWPSNGPCSSPSGPWPTPAPTTKTPAPTTTFASTPKEPTQSPRPTRQPRLQRHHRRRLSTGGWGIFVSDG